MRRAHTTPTRPSWRGRCEKGGDRQPDGGGAGDRAGRAWPPPNRPLPRRTRPGCRWSLPARRDGRRRRHPHDLTVAGGGEIDFAAEQAAFKLIRSRQRKRAATVIDGDVVSTQTQPAAADGDDARWRCHKGAARGGAEMLFSLGMDGAPDRTSPLSVLGAADDQIAELDADEIRGEPVDGFGFTADAATLAGDAVECKATRPSSAAAVEPARPAQASRASVGLTGRLRRAAQLGTGRGRGLTSVWAVR